MMYRSIASFSIRHSAGMIALWMMLALLSAGFAVKLPDALGDHGLITKGSYAEVRQQWSSRFHVPEEPVVLLFEDHSGKSKRDFHDFITRTLANVERIGGVSAALSPRDRPGMEKGTVAYALISVPGDVQERREAIAKIRERISGYSDFRVTLTGKPVVQEDVNISSKRDLKAAERIGVPVAFALLVFAFGGLLPALIPVATGVMAVVIAMGIMYVIGMRGVPLSVFVYDVIPMVGMAVCVDFALFMVGRFREEKAYHPVREAVARSTAASGKAVVVSAGCVALALISTLYIRMPIFNTVALGAMVVVAVSAVINLTFVPALLYALGNRLTPQRPIFGLRRFGRRRWHAIFSAVLRRPTVSVLVSVLILTVCVIPVRSMHLGIPGPESLPKGNESRIAAQTLLARFHSSEVSQVDMILNPMNDEDGLASRRNAERIRSDLKRDERVIRFESVSSSVPDKRIWFKVWLHGSESSKEAMLWVREIEKRYAPMNVSVGGEPKYHQEVHDEIFGRFPIVLVFVLASNFIVLCLAFRSVLIPVKAVVMNFASIGASFGALAWIFENGYFGIEPSVIAVMVPVFIFGLTFGISMDYGIFLLSRMQEVYKDTGNLGKAIREGLTASGTIITSAAAIMIAITLSFANAEVTGVKQLGIGIAAALIIDATLIRMVLMPSSMLLFGRWNWWLPFSGK